MKTTKQIISKGDRLGLLIDIVFPASWGIADIQRWNFGRPECHRMIGKYRDGRFIMEGVKIGPQLTP
jgi:hypothetical protein